ncbi:unnamed protein product [Chondrus crispus]|uniref:Uncharacterized protein n=1 Tax=Chondrus crispus TaxID=2769 RepID=R7QBD4_CHOCR|nr:unnamed protein product [Chondrus crispus]CDF34731.1 unnamed protein product [Chondrus crispus]|eukprot:XP_005714550.1 unnamed protein product [Chondrus crispus]
MLPEIWKAVQREHLLDDYMPQMRDANSAPLKPESACDIRPVLKTCSALTVRDKKRLPPKSPRRSK